MAEIKDGLLHDKKVIIEIFKSLEHGAIHKIDAIVLHRTDSASANSVLSEYQNGTKIGAHFLIGLDGKIFQTASLEQKCWHVGIMYSRCSKEHDCGKAELKTIDSILSKKGESFHTRIVNLSRYETKKTYPQRYPSNDGSIGIEVVGLYDETTKLFARPTLSQLQSLKWLVSQLAKTYRLSERADVYAHGAIAHKQASEGKSLVEYIHELTP